MNPKINKVIGDIEKTKDKIAEFQARLKELERLKTELENADIVAMVRGINIPPSELEAFARAFMEQRNTVAVPDVLPIDGNTPHDGNTPFDRNTPLGDNTSLTTMEEDVLED